MNPSPPGVRFKDRTEILDFLLEVAAATQETLDLDRILSNVASIVTRVIPSQLFAILLYSERRKGLRIRYSVGHRQEIVENLIIPLGEGLTGIAAQTRETVLSGDVRKDPNYLPALDAVRSELAAPMIARGKLVGVIDLQSTSLNAYSEYDKMLVHLLASRVGSSIDNARLYRRVDVQHRTMRTLARVSQEFSSILDLDELLRKLAAIIRSLIDYDAFAILLLDEPRQVLRHSFSIRYDEEVTPDHIPLSQGITGAAARLRQPIRIEDTAADPRYIATHPNIRSEVAVPLLLRALNTNLAERKAEAQYATLLAMLWDARTMRLTMANAGGTPPIICRGDELLNPETSGVPVGLLENRRYDETVVQLQSGDLIVLTSDGILDAFNEVGVEYGRDRLGIAIKRHCGDVPQAVVDAIFADVQLHVGEAPQFDDQTILILRVE